METRLELDVLIFPDELRVPTPEELSEWELETASQLSRPLVRLFVALYPYNPAAMSPNYDTAAEELPFVPGQIIKVGDFLFLNQPKASEKSFVHSEKEPSGPVERIGCGSGLEKLPSGDKLRAAAASDISHLIITSWDEKKTDNMCIIIHNIKKNMLL